MKNTMDGFEKLLMWLGAAGTTATLALLTAHFLGSFPGVMMLGACAWIMLTAK